MLTNTDTIKKPWESMLNDISKIEGNTNLTYYFGFRDMGVDHELFIQTRLDAPEAYGEKPFESIFRLDVKVDTENNDLKMNLIQIY